MHRIQSALASLLVSSLLAATVTICVGWPSHVNAVGVEEQAAQDQAQAAKVAAAPSNAALGQNESKIGDLEVTATLRPSDADPSHYEIQLDCRNPTEGRIAGNFMVELTRTSGNPMARVGPSPKIAWRHPEAVEVGPGETLHRIIAVPKNHAAQIARLAKAAKAAEDSDTVVASNVAYDAVAVAIEPQSPAKGQNRVVLRSSGASQKSGNVGL